MRVCFPSRCDGGSTGRRKEPALAGRTRSSWEEAECNPGGHGGQGTVRAGSRAGPRALSRRFPLLWCRLPHPSLSHFSLFKGGSRNFTSKHRTGKTARAAGEAPEALPSAGAALSPCSERPLGGRASLTCSLILPVQGSLVPPPGPAEILGKMSPSSHPDGTVQSRPSFQIYRWTGR